MALQFKPTTTGTSNTKVRTGGLQFKSNVPQTYQKQQEQQQVQPTEESRLDEFGLPKATISADKGTATISEQQMKGEEYKKQPLLKKVVGLFSVKDLISGISSLVKKKIDSTKPEAVQLMDQHLNDLQDYYVEQLSQPGGATGKSAKAVESIIKSDLGEFDKGVVGIVAHTFLPTRVITENPQAKLKNAVVQQSLNDYAQKNPIPAIIGETVGGIANLILFKEMGAGFGLSSKVGEAAGGLKNLYPTLTRIAGYAAEGGSIFGIESAVNEAFNQIQSGKLDTLKIATEGAKGAGTGALISTSGALPTLGARVAAGGTIFAGLTTASKLIQDGKLSSQDLVDIAVSGLVGSLFELAGGTKKSGIMRGQELEQLNKDTIVSRIMSNNPKLTKAEAEKLAVLMEDLPRSAVSQLNEKQKSKIQEELNNISEQLKGKTKQQQTEIMNEVIDNIKSGNSIITPTIKFTDNILKNYENAKAKVETEQGQSDPVAIKELLDAQVQLKNYQDAKQKNVFAVSTGDGQTRYAEINIVKMNDNKWAYSYNINTDTNSMVSDFLVNEFTNSSEKAIENAKQDIIKWTENQLKSAQGTTRDQLDIILNAVKNVDPKLDVPVEVREPHIEIEKTQREQILDEYRKGTLPEYNTDKEIVNLDAFIDKIRELDPENETDKILMRDGSKYEVTVSYPHSLGEMGNQTEFIYKEKPTIAELKSDILDTYKEFKKDVNKPLTAGIVAKSTRDENIEKAVDNVLKPKTQKEKVTEAVKKEPKTIKEVSEETKILEPNVRRILGVGAAEPEANKVGNIIDYNGGNYTILQSWANADGLGFLRVQNNETKKVITIKESDIGKEPKPRFAKKEPTAKLPQTSRKTEKLNQEETVNVATKIMPKKPAIPVVGTFSVKDGIMTATDLEIGTRLKTTLKDGIYKAVGKEAIQTDEFKQQDFPIVPEVSGEPMFKLMSDNFKNVIKKAVKSIDKTGIRAEIGGVSIKSDGKRIEVRSTDSYRLFKKTLPAKVFDSGKFILSNADKLEKTVDSVGGLTEATFNPKEDYIKFAGDNGEIIVRNIGGEFPDTSNVYSSFETQYLFKKKNLLNAIKELKPFMKQLGSYERGTGVKMEYDEKSRKITFTTVGKFEGKTKSVSVSAIKKKVEIPEGIENDGVIVMPIQPEGKNLQINPTYIEDALNSLEEEAIFMYAPKELTRPVLFTELNDSEMIPYGFKRGKDITIKSGTKLFHGTDLNSANSIISDGLNKTDDKTATYGRAIYLTPDYQTAQDYANETNKGQVVVFKPDKNLKLYQPTKSEREDLVDKIGDEQDEMIKEMLGEDYDGFYIPDDGRGDGGEQVILYDDSLKFLYKAEMADEVRKDNNKTAVATKPKGKRAPSGIASSGAGNIGSFEDLAGAQEKTDSQMKLYEEVKNLIKKYAKTIGEDYLPSNALGVYYPNTTNIRIKGMNDLSVAAHEITHFLDHAYKISDLLMGIKGYSVTGKPIYESETYKLRKEMTALYEQYYPGGKHTHKLRKRMLEGFATLLQKYVEQPTMIIAQYPNLVKEFLTTEGKFYKPVIGEILKDLRDIISRYQGLSALDKIGARIIDDKVNVNKNSFLRFWDKVKTEIADNIYPIEKLAKKAGVHFTKQDPSLWLRQYNSSNALIMNNINGNRGYWGWRDGELVKLHDFNWKDLIKELKKEKTANQFGIYLVARREYFMYQELKKMAEDNPDRIKLQQILNNDGFTEKEVEEAYLQNKDRFKDLEEKFDILTKEDLNFLHDTQVQLLNDEDYNRLTSQEGYASFKRYFYDEIVGEEEMPIGRVRFGTTKVSSLLHRTGSKKPIINPLASALRNHAEIMRKGMKQTIYNRIGAISEKLPDLFQRLQLKGVPDREGKIIYPQERDPNIIMARAGYKRVPILTDNVIKRTVDEVLTHQNISIFEKFLMGASRFFTKGTTGLFPGFALTNYTVDQMTGVAQTRNKYIPLYDPLREIFTATRYKESPEHKYLQEYMVMGGERQTMVGWQDMSPNELFDTIAKERAGLLKVVDALNKGMSVLALPSQWSEIMTRATEYIKSRENGKSQIVALEEAGRVTAPFHHVGRLGGGRFGKTYIKSIPFFNPGIQVLAQAIETLETPEGRARYAFVSLAVVAASIAGLGLILSAGTDEQKDLFADISPDELNKYIWLPDPDGKDLIKIRVPDQMNVFATLTNMIIADKKLNANYTAGEYLNAGMSWLPQQVDISQPTRALLSWIPQLIKPGVLTIAGVKDFPKIMPLESQMQQSKSPGLRATESTSPVAKWLGKTFNISPIKLDYLLTGYAGRATGFLTGKPGIYNPFKSMQRKYYFSSGRKVQEFYDRKEKNDQDYYDYKHNLRDFKLNERTKIIQERKKLNEISDLIGDYRDVDLDKNPQKAERLRNQILEKINKL